ncbi:MAG: hypothetical protein KJ049_07395 [Gammaproteobacteria bacterium]|jgi:hypothetical protein|nr:hypothetical protein [Gammaproteobacteria bacterium]
MSDSDNERTAFRNADTLHRRAWIDRALSGVRARLHREDEGELGQSAPPPVPMAAPQPPRPHLYVVPNRRSG